jgi:hypothetical protein
MQGLTIFDTLAEAIHAGFSVYDRTPRGYLVRTRNATCWALAIVELRKEQEQP